MPGKKTFYVFPPFQDAHIHLMIDGHPATLDDCPALFPPNIISKGIVPVGYGT